MLAFPGADLPEYVDRARARDQRLETDVVIACKPRFPGLLNRDVAEADARDPGDTADTSD